MGGPSAGYLRARRGDVDEDGQGIYVRAPERERHRARRWARHGGGRRGAEHDRRRISSSAAPYLPYVCTHPATDTWAVGASLSARAAHGATRLADGRVLVSGGMYSTSQYLWGAPYMSAQIYDSALNTWAPAAAMSVGREAHASLLLANGKVMVLGGSAWGGLTEAALVVDIYDSGLRTRARRSPRRNRLARGQRRCPTGACSRAGRQPTRSTTRAGTRGSRSRRRARSGRRRSQVLPNGDVLVAGGQADASAEIYHPSGIQGVSVPIALGLRERVLRGRRFVA